QDCSVIKIITSRNVKAVDRLLSGTAAGDRTTAAYVAAIVSAVRRRGDPALLQYARRFDGLKEPLEVSPEEIEEGAARVPPKVREALVAAARLAGVDRLFRLGGAHAIAALAYGTASVPRVDKIVGTGNRFVAAAKAIVAQDCAIDFYAGPTEIVIVSERGNPEWIAADL